jgi:hypothetical protein
MAHLCVFPWFSLRSPFLIRTAPSDLILTILPFQRPCLQAQSHSEMLAVRISTCELSGGHGSHHSNFKGMLLSWSPTEYICLCSMICLFLCGVPCWSCFSCYDCLSPDSVVHPGICILHPSVSLTRSGLVASSPAGPGSCYSAVHSVDISCTWNCKLSMLSRVWYRPQEGTIQTNKQKTKKQTRHMEITNLIETVMPVLPDTSKGAVPWTASLALYCQNLTDMARGEPGMGREHRIWA